VLEAIALARLAPIVETFATAHEHLHRYRFIECRATLETLPRDLVRTLQAEADYIRSMALMSTRSERDRAQGRAVLAAWSGLEDE